MPYSSRKILATISRLIIVITILNGARVIVRCRSIDPSTRPVEPDIMFTAMHQLKLESRVGFGAANTCFVMSNSQA